MITIDLHGLSLAEAKQKLVQGLENAYDHGESVVRIIHGQGKHSAFFPVIKSQVRHWLEEAVFARAKIAVVYRGEDGSPYTSPNAGETIVVFKRSQSERSIEPQITIAEEEERERRRNIKAMRADHLRTARRRKPR